MSCYWYLVCDEHKEKVFAASSHASGNFHFEQAMGGFVSMHSGCKVRFLCDPDDDSHPGIVDYTEIES